MRTLVIVVAVIIGMFASAGPATPVRAQIIYQPPVSGQLVPVTGPNCPSIPIAGGPALQTAPWAYTYSVCTYPRLGSSDGRANVTVPAGLTIRWRYYTTWTSWWGQTFSQEVTAFAYSGQTVLTDWFEVYYTSYLTYAPGQPIFYPPPGQWPPPSTQPPTWPSPMPGLPAPGTPVPSETRTGVGQTLAFAAGWPVAGWRVQHVSGRTAYQCYTVTFEPGWLTDGIINPADGIARHAPGPCYFP